jgi:hypothetical protein
VLDTIGLQPMEFQFRPNRRRSVRYTIGLLADGDSVSTKRERALPKHTVGLQPTEFRCLF